MLHAKPHIIALALALLAAAAPRAQAAASRIDLNLAPVLTQRGTTADGVQAVAVATAAEAGDWRRGLGGEARPGSLVVKRTGTEPVKSTFSLVVQYSGLRPGQLVTAYACSNGFERASCRELGIDASGRFFRFAVDGDRWEVELLAHPCEAGLTCELRLPSWRVAAMGRRTDSLEIPQAVAAVDDGRGIVLMDVDRQQPWLSLDRNEAGHLADLGALRSARFVGSGRLALGFAGGFLVLDFITDDAWVIDAGGVHRSLLGLAQLAADPFEVVYTRPASGAGRGDVLAVEPGVVVWSDGYLRWSYRSVPRENAYVVAETRLQRVGRGLGGALAGYRADGRSLAVADWDAERAAFVERERVQTDEPLSVDGEATWLSSGGAYVLGATGGLRMLDGSALRATSFAGTIAAFDGGALLVTRGAGATCKTLLETESDDSDTAFAGTGVELPCGRLAAVATGEQRVLAATLSGARLAVGILKP